MSDVRVVFRKWGRTPHWEYDAVRLGQDEHGVWLGLPPGTPISRPGASFLTGQAQVVLVPVAASFVATFYDNAGGAPCDTYVDITTEAVWDRDEKNGRDIVGTTDLDLDVVRGWTGRVWVDDEDEFADHRVRFGYPDEVVASAVKACEQVRHELETRISPYNGKVSTHWMSRIEGKRLHS